jgi:hypothetical protein
MTNEVPDENLCFKLKFVAVYCVIMFILSSLFNAMLLWAFSQYKQIKNNMDRVKIAITVLNIVANTLEYPFVIVSNFSCRLVPLQHTAIWLRKLIFREFSFISR